MYKELRFTLTDTSATPVVLSHAPSGWQDASMQMERSKKYYGVFRSFTIPMKWSKEAATIIRNEFYTYGMAAYCGVKIEKLDKISLQYEIVFLGKIDFITFKDQDYTCEANMIDGGLAEILKSREGDEYDLTADYWIATDADGLKYISVTDIQSFVTPAANLLATFKALVNKMSDENAKGGTTQYAAKSDLLQTAFFTKLVLTNESSLKWTNSGLAFHLITSLADFFASINAITPIGMGIEIIDGKETLVLEEREYFFDQLNTIINLAPVKSIGVIQSQDHNYGKIKCGWPNKSYNTKANSGNDDASIDECNTETFFTIPNFTSKTEYDICGKYRADWQGVIELTAPDSQVTEDTKDFGLFFIEIEEYMIGEVLHYKAKYTDALRKSYDHGIVVTKGMMNLSPKRCLLRHASFISQCCIGLDGRTVDFNNGTNDQANNETGLGDIVTEWLEEYTGFTIDSTGGYFKPVLIDFEVPYPQVMMSLVNTHPTGIIGFSYLGTQYYGYINKLEVKLAGRGAVKYQLLSTYDNDLTKLKR